MRVKIIEEQSMHKLEQKVNNLLAKLDPRDVIDIKYTGAAVHSRGFVSYYSVMLIYIGDTEL